MKYSSIIVSASLLLSATMLSSCSDVLDTAPDGSLTIEEILQDPVKVSGLLAKCYDKIPQKAYTYSNFEPLPTSLSDDAWSSDEGYNGLPVNVIYNGRQNAESHPLRDTGGNFANGGSTSGVAIGSYWANYWAQIYQCNQFLNLIDRAVVDNDPTKAEAIRSRYKAEAHLLRAFFYSELVRWFGKLPIVEDTYAFDADFSGLKRESVYDVVKFIISDCDYAINCPELPWRIDISSERMRMTKALAWAIKSRMSLTAASPLFNEGNNYWEWAYKINDEALKALLSNNYELYTTVKNTTVYGTGKGSAFRELVATQADISSNPRDKETIFQHRANNGHWIWHIGYIGSTMNNTAYCKACPTQELIDAFETTDGQPVLNLANPYLDEKHLKPNYNAANKLYDPQNPYENRDPRLHETALCNGDKFIWDGAKQTVESFVGGKNQINFDPSNRKNTRTGYYHCKTVAPNIDGGSGNVYGTMLPWKFYRLAEIYLNLAEAAAEAGHLDEARKAANAVRARVGMPELPSLGKEETILRIHNERRVELAWEEIRYFDLRRWQSPEGNLHTTCSWLTAMYITRNSDGSFKYERRNIWSKERGGADTRDLLLPLTTAEAARLKSSTGVDWQNPGW